MAGNKAFGKKIRLLREAKKITDPAFSLRRFSDAVGLSPTFLSKMENGEFDPPRPEKIKAMAELLEVNADDLLELAGRADPDLVEKVKPKVVADFLRTVTDRYSDDEIREMTKRMKEGKEFNPEGKK